MPTESRTLGRTLFVAARALILLTAILGVGYTFVITGIGQLALPDRANGSIVRDADGTPVASALLGQAFTGADGVPLREYFQPRPSAAGDGYDGASSSGTNLGPEHPELVAAIEERRATIAAFNGVEPESVPADALTASASGLDPHISPEFALLQVERVAEARGLDASEVRALVEAAIEAPDLGYLGETRVNVIALNVALDEREG